MSSCHFHLHLNFLGRLYPTQRYHHGDLISTLAIFLDQLFLLAKLDIDSPFLLAKHFSSRPLNSHSLSSNMARQAISNSTSLSVIILARLLISAQHLVHGNHTRDSTHCSPRSSDLQRGTHSRSSSLSTSTSSHSNLLMTIHVCLVGSNASTTTSRNSCLWLYFPLADLTRHEQFHSSRSSIISLSSLRPRMSSSLLFSDIAHQAPYAIDASTICGTSTIDISLNHASFRSTITAKFFPLTEVFFYHHRRAQA